MKLKQTDRITGTRLLGLALALILSAGQLHAASTAEKILDSFGRETGLFVVIGAGDKNAPTVAADLGQNGNSLVHVIAADAEQLAAINKVIAEKKVKGCVSAEQLDLAKLPYRDYLVNVMVVMDLKRAEQAGLVLLQKPVSVSSLLTHIQEALRRPDAV